MTTALFHINDNCLQIQQASSLEQSRGYAWLKGEQVFFDLDTENIAVNHCRLSPQEINSQYWQQCEQSAIPTNAANMRHAADLVWQHLKQLQKQHGLLDVAFVVPSHYQESNLQLLLGIARACELNVEALLNKAVFAIQQTQLQKNQSQQNDCLHIDVQLHQTVCTQVSVDNGTIKLGAVEVIQNVGIQAMYDALLKAIQANFISNDRFDPLHHAQTEQQVFDQLEKLAVEINNTGKANVTVDHQQRLYTTSIDSKQWQACLAPFTKTLISVGAKYSQVFIDLNNAFDGQALSECDAANFVNLTTPSIDVDSFINDLAASDNTEAGDSLVYKTQLPELSASSLSNAGVSEVKPAGNQQQQKVADVASNSIRQSSSQSSSTSKPSKGVTHILCSGQAVALQHALIELSNNQLAIKHSEQGNLQTLLNDGTLFVLNGAAQADMSDLQVNDRLGSNLADGVITAVQVL